MKDYQLKRIAWYWLAVDIAIVALLICFLSSCNVLKDKQSRKAYISSADTSSVKTVVTTVKTESGNGKESSSHERETTITPTLIRDTINNTVKVYPTTVIREKGEVQREYVYLNSDSTRFEKLEQAITTLTLAMSEQTKHKESGTPWYVWFFGSFMVLIIAVIIYLIVRK